MSIDSPWLNLMHPAKSPFVAGNVLRWCRGIEENLPSRDYKRLSWWTQAAFDAGLINDFQRYCINYYSQD